MPEGMFNQDSLHTLDQVNGAIKPHAPVDSKWEPIHIVCSNFVIHEINQEFFRNFTFCH